MLRTPGAVAQEWNRECGIIGDEPAETCASDGFGGALVAVIVERLADFLVELSHSTIDERFPF